MNGQGVYADRDGLRRDDRELFTVRAVLIEFIDHLLGDALGSCACELVDLFGVGEVRVERSELATTISEKNH